LLAAPCRESRLSELIPPFPFPPASFGAAVHDLGERRQKATIKAASARESVVSFMVGGLLGNKAPRRDLPGKGGEEKQTKVGWAGCRDIQLRGKQTEFCQ